MAELTPDGAGRAISDAEAAGVIAASLASEVKHDLESVQRQARRYLEAVHGKGVWYKAPETFASLVERWIWALAGGKPALAEECIAQIERQAAAVREGRS